MNKKKKSTARVAPTLQQPGAKEYVLRLFITAGLPNSVHAVSNSKSICEKYLAGRYSLEVFDIYQQPDLAISEDIVAVPVLIKKLPLPEERIIGDLSDTDIVLKMLNLGQ